MPALSGPWDSPAPAVPPSAPGPQVPLNSDTGARGPKATGLPSRLRIPLEWSLQTLVSGEEQESGSPVPPSVCKGLSHSTGQGLCVVLDGWSLSGLPLGRHVPISLLERSLSSLQPNASSSPSSPKAASSPDTFVKIRWHPYKPPTRPDIRQDLFLWEREIDRPINIAQATGGREGPSEVVSVERGDRAGKAPEVAGPERNRFLLAHRSCWHKAPHPSPQPGRADPQWTRWPAL